MTTAPGDLELAVVGVGQMGRRHARVYGRISGARLVAVVDPDQERAAAVAEELGCAAYADVSQLLTAHPNLAGVSVAVPTAAHVAAAEPLIRRGVACLVEKPLAPTARDARVLAGLAQSHRVVLHVGHTERFNPAVRAVAAMKIQPRFIEVHRISPMTFRSLDVGVVMDMMIHDLDVVLMLVGCPLQSVEATGVAVLGPHEDVANARLTFQSGCVANVTASRLAMKTERKMRLFSEDAYVSFDYARRCGVVIRKSQNADMLAQVRRQLEDGADLSTLDYSSLVHVDELTMDPPEPPDAPDPTGNPNGQPDDPLTAELRFFLQAIRNARRTTRATPVPTDNASENHSGKLPTQLPGVPGKLPKELPGLPGGGDPGVAAIEAAERVIAAIRAHHWEGLPAAKI